MPLGRRYSSFAPEIIISNFPDSLIWRKAIAEFVQPAHDSCHLHHLLKTDYLQKQARQ